MTIGIEATRSLRSAFVAHAARTPAATALVVADRALTYGEVDARARAWAAELLARLDRPVTRVGVFGYRSEVSYLGVLAALYAGATFVPLNPTYPSERTRTMIAAAELDAILVDDTAAPQLDAVLSGVEPRPLVLSTKELARCTRALSSLPGVADKDHAYLLFTSGSTGKPKGVPITHGNVLHFLDVMAARYDIRADDRFSQTFDQTFDLSVFDLFLAWERGASVYAFDSLALIAPGRFVNKHALTVWFSVPSIPALMRKKGTLKPGLFPSLRWSLFCGEPLPRASAEAWQAAAPGSIVENLYGPTELTIACFAYRWRGAESAAACVNDVVPIGRPYPGLSERIVDDELCVSGPQTTPGYWRNAAADAERFLILDGARYYRTGDRVRCLDSGDYVYLGRTDHQVKVLGHRVELAEIEAVLRDTPGVVDAIAVAWPMSEGTASGIVAFVTPESIDPVALTDAARRRLPDYMVPREILREASLPLNANGKIDRGALQQRLKERG